MHGFYRAFRLESTAIRAASALVFPRAMATSLVALLQSIRATMLPVGRPQRGESGFVSLDRLAANGLLEWRGPSRGGCRGARSARGGCHLPNLIANVIVIAIRQIGLQRTWMPGFERPRRGSGESPHPDQVLGVGDPLAYCGGVPSPSFQRGRDRSTTGCRPVRRLFEPFEESMCWRASGLKAIGVPFVGVCPLHYGKRSGQGTTEQTRGDASGVRPPFCGKARARTGCLRACSGDRNRPPGSGSSQSSPSRAVIGVSNGP